MNLSAYMSSIVSEVQQFGKAYVDSLVSPGDDKDHNESGRDFFPKEQEARAISVGSAPSSTQTLSFFSTPPKTAAQSKTILTDSSNGAPLSHHPVAAVDGHGDESGVTHRCSAPSTPPSAGPFVAEAVMTTATRKTLTKKGGKAPRSKFGAVKLQSEANVTAAMPPAVAAVSSSSASSHGVLQSDSASLPERPATAVACTAAPKRGICGWSKRRDGLLQLLRGTLEQRAEPAASEWAQEAFSHFTMNVAGEAIASAVNDTTNSSVVATTTSLLTSPVRPPSESAWRHAGVELRRCVRRVMPREVFGDCPSADHAVLGRDVVDDDLASCPELVRSLACGGERLRRAFHETLATTQYLCGEHRLRSLLLLSSRSRESVASGVSEFLALSYTPLLRTAAAIAVKEDYEQLPCTPFQEQLEGKALAAWVKDMTAAFCGELIEVEAEWWRRLTSHAAAGELVATNGEADDCPRLNAMVNAMHDGTAALWLMREVMILTLRIVWALFYNAA